MSLEFDSDELESTITKPRKMYLNRDYEAGKNLKFNLDGKIKDITVPNGKIANVRVIIILKNA